MNIEIKKNYESGETEVWSDEFRLASFSGPWANIEASKYAIEKLKEPNEEPAENV